MPDDIFERLAAAAGFEWDGGNAPKIWERHGVSQGECEQVFFAEPLVIAADARHSEREQRWACWGRTLEGRLLVVIFTLRNERIRPISARDMNRKERDRYDEAEDEANS